jgi:hypothetical protein
MNRTYLVQSLSTQPLIIREIEASIPLSLVRHKNQDRIQTKLTLQETRTPSTEDQDPRLTKTRRPRIQNTRRVEMRRIV